VVAYRALPSRLSTIKSDDNGTVSSVTGKHHVRQKREPLQTLANEIRRIVGNAAELHYADAAMRRASCSAVRILRTLLLGLFSSVLLHPVKT
jgi:hypothetical protein